jgi:hypothetical protein
MKKLILLLVLFVAGSSSAAIVITDQAGLQAIALDLAGDYELGNDIVLTGPFTSIMEFTGTFDGKMHAISGLTKTVVGTRASGIFGRTVAGSEIRNVGMTNVSLTSDGESPNYVAALINDSKGLVEKCWLDGGTITVTGATGGNNSGSLIGLNRDTGIVRDCYVRDVTISINGLDGIGGFVNSNGNGLIENCYVDAVSVDLTPRTFSTASGFGRDLGGLGITSCYYNMDVTTATDPAIPETYFPWDDGSGMARTTAQMKTQANYEGWDFENTWYIKEGQTSPQLVGVYIDPNLPEVDAGPDMLTWSGEPVELDPNVVNNDPCEPQAPLTYLWTANPTTGVVFDPSADVEDPNVTITKPATVTTAVAITNPGFETPVLADGADTSTPPAWTDGYYNVAEPGVWVVGDAEAGAYNPVAGADYNGVAPEGENVMYATSGVGFDRGMSQVLSAKLEANTQYILSALVGNPFLFNGSTAAGNYRIELLAGGVLLKSDTGASPANDKTWKTASLTYDSGAGPAQLGQALAIRLVAVNFTNGKGVDFDDVKLTAEGPAPVPYVVTLTLAVNNEGSTRPDVKDTMTIDVYDDACQMARLGEGKAADNPGDFDGDCITDGNDLAELAAQWLTGDVLTVPIIKP